MCGCTRRNPGRVMGPAAADLFRSARAVEHLAQRGPVAVPQPSGGIMSSYQYERLSSLDSCFLAFETVTTPMHIGATAIFEGAPLSRPNGGVDMDSILAHIAARLHWIPRYRERLAHIPLEGHPVWV